MSESTLFEALEITLNPVRATVSSRVEQTSLRVVAREIGMSPAGLKKFLEGTTPYSPTVRRLRHWYERHAARSRELGLLDARVALDVLLHELGPEAGRSAAFRVLEAVGQGYDQIGQPTPAWLEELQGQYAPRGRRSSLGKFRGLGAVSEEFARAKQAEIDREDRSPA